MSSNPFFILLGSDISKSSFSHLQQLYPFYYTMYNCTMFVLTKSRCRYITSLFYYFFFHVQLVDEIDQLLRSSKTLTRAKLMLSSANPLLTKKQESLWSIVYSTELSYHLDTITAFTAVEIFGRFLSAQVISGKEEAMYASVVAVHISSKYHETGLFRRPVLSELLECVTRGSPDLNGLNCRLGMAMEDRILNALDMEIDVPSVHTFLIRFYKAAKIWPDTKTTLMASFYAKLGIWDYDLKMTYPTEKLAAAALYAACVLTHNIRMWRGTYRSHTVFKDTELWKCTKRMMELHLVGLGGHESCSWIIKNMILISQLPKKLHTSSVR